MVTVFADVTGLPGTIVTVDITYGFCDPHYAGTACSMPAIAPMVKVAGSLYSFQLPGAIATKSRGGGGGGPVPAPGGTYWAENKVDYSIAATDSLSNTISTSTIEFYPYWPRPWATVFSNLSASTTYPGAQFWVNGSSFFNDTDPYYDPVQGLPLDYVFPAETCDVSVTLTPGGTTFTGKTSGDGGYSIAMTAPASPGQYTVSTTVSNSSDNRNVPGANDTAIGVIALPQISSVSVNLSKSSTFPSEPIWVNGTARYDNGSAANLCDVNVTVLGTTIYNNSKTLGNGNYSMKFTAPAAFNTYTVRVTVSNATYPPPKQNQTALLVRQPKINVAMGGLSATTMLPLAELWINGTAVYDTGLTVQNGVVNLSVPRAAIGANGTTNGTGEFTIHIVGPAVPGSYALNVSVWGALYDNSGNASETITVVATPLPDLTVSSSSITFFSPSGLFLEGKEIFITARVKNAGILAAADVPVSFSLAGGSHPIAWANVTASIGKTSTANVSWTALPGAHTVQVSVDPDNVTEESVETNNNATRDLFIDNIRDIAITASDISFSSPDSAFVNGRIITVSAFVKNIGSVDLNGTSVAIGFAGDPAWYIADVLVDVPAHGSAVAQATWKAGYGNHTFIVVLDRENAVNETDETNNAASKTLFIDVIRDLSVSAGDIMVVPRDGRFAAGRKVTIFALVRNSGSTALDGVQVLFAVDGNIVAGVARVTIPVGGAAFAQATWTATKGDHTFGVSVDPENEIAEVNEANNQASRSLTFDGSSAAGGANALPPEDAFANAVLVGAIAIAALISTLLALAASKR
ncbi:MAG: hypothetical protein HZB92_00610 [Euryarchaeota archaeon]|nr:hypothetical protein [Euryarchaeota archaeon]